MEFAEFLGATHACNTATQHDIFHGLDRPPGLRLQRRMLALENSAQAIQAALGSLFTYLDNYDRWQLESKQHTTKS